MRGISHALSGAAAGAAVAEFGLHLHPLGTVVLAAYTAGTALGPDMDQACSTAARSFGFLTRAMCWVIGRLSGGHRHLTHSALGVAIFTGLAWLACHFRHDLAGKIGLAVLVALFVSAGLEALHLTDGHLADVIGLAAAAVVVFWGWGLAYIPGCVALGWTVHLLGDSCTDSGVMWLYPFSSHRFRLPEPFALTTGTLPERFIVDPLLLGLIGMLGWAEIR